MNQIQRYAIKLVAEGAESTAEDDLDEDGEFDSGEDHCVAQNLAILIAHAIRDNPEIILALVGHVVKGGKLHDDA